MNNQHNTFSAPQRLACTHATMCNVTYCKTALDCELRTGFSSVPWTMPAPSNACLRTLVVAHAHRTRKHASEGKHASTPVRNTQAWQTTGVDCWCKRRDNAQRQFSHSACHYHNCWCTRSHSVHQHCDFVRNPWSTRRHHLPEPKPELAICYAHIRAQAGRASRT